MDKESFTNAPSCMTAELVLPTLHSHTYAQNLERTNVSSGGSLFRATKGLQAGGGSKGVWL